LAPGSSIKRGTLAPGSSIKRGTLAPGSSIKRGTFIPELSCNAKAALETAQQANKAIKLIFMMIAPLCG
jgi:hypothetical protein